MGMDKEWEELKERLRKSGMPVTFVNWVADQMTELERRSLPERVAELVDKFDFCTFLTAFRDHNRRMGLRADDAGYWFVFYNTALEYALRSGDLTELQKWVR